MKSYAKTDVGVRRDVNQDYFFATEKATGSFQNLYIVADGMGGHADWRLCVETMC